MDKISGKNRKHLNIDIWYHGTVYSNWDSICENGVLSDFNKDTSDALDFGYGFYLAPTRERAEHYILSMMKNSGFYDKYDSPVILGFEFNPLEWFENDEYNTKIFDKYNDEFALFVFENRTENIAGCRQHDYDVIYGVMSDSIPTLKIMEYKAGKITKDDVIEALKTPTSMKQLSLHNQNICDIIKLKEAYLIDRETDERKELDINDYRK